MVVAVGYSSAPQQCFRAAVTLAPQVQIELDDGEVSEPNGDEDSEPVEAGDWGLICLFLNIGGFLK